MKEGEAEGEKSSVYWLIHPMPTAARARPAKAWSEELQVSHVGSRNPNSWAIIHCLLDTFAKSPVGSVE